MPELMDPKGVLRPGWSAMVDDYAIDAGWALGGEILVVGDASGSVFGFHGTSGTTQWVQRAVHEGGVLAVAIHPDGATFATAGQDGRVRIWNAADGQVSHTLDLGSGWVEKLAWSPDGSQVAASLSRTVHVYTGDGAEVWRSPEHPSTVSAVAWSGSQELATACYGRVAFFAVSTGELRQALEWKGSLVSMVLSPDGDTVACGSQDNSVHFWRRSTGQDSTMSGYPGKPSALDFDADGTLLATGGGTVVTVWSFEGDGPEGTRPGLHEAHVKPITALSFEHRSGRLASAARDGAVIVWRLGSDGDGGPVGAAAVGRVVGGLAWRSDGRSLAAFDANGGVTTWRVKPPR
jgi:WD40 repeat protein